MADYIGIYIEKDEHTDITLYLGDPKEEPDYPLLRDYITDMGFDPDSDEGLWLYWFDYFSGDPKELEVQKKSGKSPTELIGDLERFQLDSVPSSTTREYSGFASLLLFRDQPPVELIFERFRSVDDERHSSWVINLHTSLEHLGEIWLKSTFSQSNVELVMWAVEKKTAELAKEGSLDLQEAFSELGLTMQSFQILNSERTNFPERSIPTHSNLDLEA